MGRLPDPNQQSYSRALAELEKRVHELETRSQYANTGHAPDGNGGIESTAFDGDLAAGDAGSIGWAMNDQRAAFGELFLRPGSVGNDSLTTPLVIGQGNNGATNFPVSGVGDSTVISLGFVVPDGFTGFSCIAMGGVSAVNGTASLDYLMARVWIDSFYGDTLFQPCSGSNGSGSVTVFKQGQLSGLTPGQTVNVTLRVWASSGTTWPASASNIASLNTLVFWLR